MINNDGNEKENVVVYLLLGEINDILKIRIFPIKFYEF